MTAVAAIAVMGPSATCRGEIILNRYKAVACNGIIYFFKPKKWFNPNSSYERGLMLHDALNYSYNSVRLFTKTALISYLQFTRHRNNYIYMMLRLKMHISIVATRHMKWDRCVIIYHFTWRTEPSSIMLNISIWRWFHVMASNVAHRPAAIIGNDVWGLCIFHLIFWWELIYFMARHYFVDENAKDENRPSAHFIIDIFSRGVARH